MPVRIDLSSIEFSAIAQLGKDYEILYRALERIADMEDEHYGNRAPFPRAMQKVANMALDDVTIRP